MMRWFNNISLKKLILISLGIIIAHAIVLYLMGQVPICQCGFVKLWHGITHSSENSQHLSDWYSFSHIIHGFGFYWFAWLLGRKRGWTIAFMFLLALTVEVGWEIFENTDLIINRYRETTISLDYYGDSVINSVFDVLFMILGFWLAVGLPVWSIIILTIAMEVWVGWAIRDNLALNIIMLLYPINWILEWQSGD